MAQAPSLGRGSAKKKKMRAGGLIPRTISNNFSNGRGAIDMSRCHPAGQIFSCTRSRFSLALFQSSITVPVYLSLAFGLSDLTAYAEFTALFDEYRIPKIEVWAVPRVTESTVAAGFGTMVSCVDYQDNAAVGSYNELLEHENAIQTAGTTGIYHCWTPNIALAAYSGAFTSYSSVANQWLDVNSPGVYHYGLKFASQVSGTAQAYDFYFRYWLEFRHTS
jgi:hypothetical protein